MIKSVIGLGWFIISMAALVPAQNWECEGGDPGRSYYSPDTVLKPPLKLSWRFRLEGATYWGQAIVAENKVFFRSINAPIVYALDSKTGEVVWKVWELGTAGDGICYYNGKVYYAASLTGHATLPNGMYLVCRNAATGEWVWAKPCPNNITTGFSTASLWVKYSPVGFKGAVYGSGCDKATGEGVYFSMNAETGDLIWEYRIADRPICVPPVIDTVNNIVFGSASKPNSRPTYDSVGVTFAYDIAKRDTLWTNTADFTHPIGHDGATLCYKAGRLYVNTNSTYSAVNSAALNAADGQLLYKPTTVSWGGSVAVSVGDQYVAGGMYGQPANLSTLTGTGLGNVAKFFPGNFYAGHCTSPVQANGYMYRASVPLAVINIDAIAIGAPPKIWKYSTVGGSCSTISIGDHKVFQIDRAGWLYCFENE